MSDLPPLHVAVGDLVQFTREVEGIGVGARYVVTGIIGWGIDLEAVSAGAPPEVRILNSEFPEYCRNLDRT